MREEEINNGDVLTGDSKHGIFLIRVSEIKTVENKTRVVGTILRVLSPELTQNSFKQIGKTWEFGCINVHKPTDEELNLPIATNLIDSWNLRLEKLNRLIEINPELEYIKERVMILNTLLKSFNATCDAEEIK